VIWDRTFIPGDYLYSYEGIIPWTIAWPTCVFNRTEETNWLIFDGEMIINYNENVGYLRDTEIIRYFEHRLWFQVRFPKNIVISTDTLRVYSSVNILASITEQVFESGVPQLPGTAHVKLLTSVQSPFQLTGPISIDGDTSKFAMSINGPICLDDGSVCEQMWDIDIIPKLNECNFDGLNTFNFSIKCNPSNISNCPLDDNTDTGSIQFILQSENF
jgi:hypothetical protein